MNEAFVNYLKKKPELDCVMQAWKKQYIKLGHCGGTITLHHLSEETKASLSGLLSKDYTYSDPVTISYTFWCKQIAKTNFDGCDFDEVLQIYFDNEIITNKEIKASRSQLLDESCSSLTDRYKGTILTDYVNYLISGSSTLSLVVKKALLSDTANEMMLILDALCNLPYHSNSEQLITVYGASTLNDPHGFDENRQAYQFLIDYLCFLEHCDKDSLTLLQRHSLLNKYGLVRDDISVMTLATHLLASSHGHIHPGWSGFYETYEPMNISLQNLANIDSIQPLDKIYVVENHSVFQMLSLTIKDKQLNQGIICTSGQLNSADISLLQLCHSPLCYCGDFDPEGLSIAQKVLDLCPNVTLWHYSDDDYYHAISDITISDKRLKSMDKLTNPTLQHMADLLRKEKKAGYQEKLLSVYINDLAID